MNLCNFSSPKANWCFFHSRIAGSLCVNINSKNLVNNSDTSCGNMFRVLNVLFVYDNIVTYLCSTLCQVIELLVLSSSTRKLKQKCKYANFYDYLSFSFHPGVNIARHSLAW